jgi:hypothetical protein
MESFPDLEDLEMVAIGAGAAVLETDGEAVVGVELLPLPLPLLLLGFLHLAAETDE